MVVWQLFWLSGQPDNHLFGTLVECPCSLLMLMIRGMFKKFVAWTWREGSQGHLMYGNTTCQYETIHQEKGFQIHLLFLQAILEVAYLQAANPEKLKLQNIPTMLSQVKVGDLSFIYKQLINTCIVIHCNLY